MNSGTQESTGRHFVQNVREVINLFSPMVSRKAGIHSADAARWFIRHVDQGRYRDAVALFPQSMIASIGLERLESILYAEAQELRLHGGVERLDILSENEVCGRAEVVVAIKYWDGSTDQEHIALMWESGGWKVDMSH